MQKVAVLLWLYNIDRWSIIKQALMPIQHHISLFAGLCKDTYNSHIAGDIIDMCHSTDGKIEFFPNIGADINSFLHQIIYIDKKQYPVFLKLHSKNSVFSNRYRLPWMEMFIHNLIGDEGIFLKNRNLFNKKDDCGIVAPKKFIINNNEHTNHEKILELCKYLDINYDTILNKSFVGGTMFFGKTEIFQRHLDASITDILCQKLSIEAKHIEDKFSGKYSQSLERIFGYLMSINNLKIYQTINRSLYKIYGNYLQDRNPLHLHIISNNFCYIEEIPMLKGRVLDDNSSRITIEWCDHISHTQQEFTKLSNKHLIYKNV